MDPDTRIGGKQDRFPETSRSAVFALHCEDAVTRTRAWDTLAEAYWKPLYKYARFKWKLSNEDAKDLVQGFFRHAVEKNVLGVYDERQSAFRTFLRTCFDRYAANEWQAAQRLKRGGSTQWTALEDNVPIESTVENLFHDEWVRNIFALAVSDLELESKLNGLQMQLEVSLATIWQIRISVPTTPPLPMISTSPPQLLPTIFRQCAAVFASSYSTGSAR